MAYLPGGEWPQVVKQMAEVYDPEALQRGLDMTVLKKNGFANSITQRAIDDFRGIYETGTPEEVGISLNKVGSIVLNQMMTTIAEVTPKQYLRRNMESWQGKLLGKAPYAARDMARYHWSEIAFQDARSLQVPVLGTVRNIDAEVKHAEFSSYRYGRGIEVALDTILTEKGMRTILTGMNQLVEGALLTQAIVMTQELVSQQLYEQLRLKRCKTPADYEQYRIAANAEFGVFNKTTEDPFATIQQRCVQETPKATSTLNTWIFPQHLLNDAKNERKEAKDFSKTGRPKSWRGSTDNESIQQVDSVMGDSATIYPLPNTIADTPLEQSLRVGIAFLMGQSPYCRVPRAGDPRNYDIKAASFASESYNYVSMEEAIKHLCLFGDDGNVKDINAKHDFNAGDKFHDPFSIADTASRGSDKPKSIEPRPIKYIGEYGLRNKQTLHGHFEMLFDLAAKQLGRTKEQCQQIIAAWLSVVRQSDMESFDALNNLEIKGGAKLKKNRYGIPIARVSAHFNAFASSYDSLLANARYVDREKADANADIIEPALNVKDKEKPAVELNTAHTAASQFLELLIAAYNIETAIHTSTLFNANLLPPEVLAQEMPEIGVWYTHFIEACPSIGSHWQLFVRGRAATNVETEPDSANVIAATARVKADYKRLTGVDYNAPVSLQVYDQLAGIVDVLTNFAMVDRKKYEDWIKANTAVATQPVDLIKNFIAKWPDGVAGKRQLQLLEKTTADPAAPLFATTLSIPRRRQAEFWAWVQDKAGAVKDKDKEKAADKDKVKWSLQTGSLRADEGTTGRGALTLNTIPEIGKVDGEYDFRVAGTAGRLYSKSTSSTATGPEPYNAVNTETANVRYADAYRSMYETAQSTVFQDHLSCLTQTANASTILMGLPTLFAHFNLACNLNAVRHGIMPLVNILLWQTPIFHVSGIVGLVPGAETGLVNTTQANVAMGLSVPTKNVQVSLTFRLGVWILKPENVYNVRGAKFNGVLGGASVGNDQLGDRIAERIDKGFFVNKQGESVSLLPLPMALDDWPEDKCISSVINAYPALPSDDNRPTNGGTLSTGYRINHEFKIYRRGVRAFKDPVFSPGRWLTLSDNGQFETLHKDKGIFREFADPEKMHKFLHGQRSGDINAY